MHIDADLLVRLERLGVGNVVDLYSVENEQEIVAFMQKNEPNLRVSIPFGLSKIVENYVIGKNLRNDFQAVHGLAQSCLQNYFLVYCRLEVADADSLADSLQDHGCCFVFDNGETTLSSADTRGLEESMSKVPLGAHSIGPAIVIVVDDIFTKFTNPSGTDNKLENFVIDDDTPKLALQGSHCIDVLRFIHRNENLATFVSDIVYKLKMIEPQTQLFEYDVTCFAGGDVPLTMSYFKNHGDDEEFQRQVSKHYGLGTRIPWLRETCSIHNRIKRLRQQGSPDNDDDDKMRDLQHQHRVVISPHRFPNMVEPSGLRNATTTLIQGDFGYYHYNTGGVDDRGWGCAYRSLQMVFSWYLLNGFTELEVPSIGNIQAKLVEMGVMDASFHEGCKKWIGSQELGWLLNSWLDIESRFIMINRGEQVKETIISQLVEHFTVFGSPIIICGANLALTIIGVAHESVDEAMLLGKLPQSKILIADPHYAGEDVPTENLVCKQKQLEGYKAIPVGYRIPNNLLFKTGASYTFLFPLLPSSTKT